MSTKDEAVTFLSCFKCGRIVRSTDSDCPRCGMSFGPGTLFECPFCAGLVWRSAESCSTCKTDLLRFAKEIQETLEGFSMDGFVDDIIESELENIRRGARRVACPSCGLMIRGDEDHCPRCDLNLRNAKVDCPVCGEKVPISEDRCWSCDTVFSELIEEEKERAEKVAEAIRGRLIDEEDAEIQKIRDILIAARDEKKVSAEIRSDKKKGIKPKKVKKAKKVKKTKK